MGKVKNLSHRRFFDLCIGGSLRGFQGKTEEHSREKEQHRAEQRLEFSFTKGTPSVASGNKVEG